MLKDCTHCGTSPENCDKNQIQAVEEKSAQLGEPLTSEDISRTQDVNKCCPNCQHIA